MPAASHGRRLDRVGASQAAEEAALAAIVRSSQDAVIAMTVTGEITAWNDGAVKLYGYCAEDVLGSNIERMFPPDALVEERARHANVIAGVAESSHRCRRLRADGQVIEVVMSMSPVRTSLNQVIGSASISRSLNAREQNDPRIASLLEAAPDGMVSVDSAGVITMANTQLAEMFGYAIEDLLGSPIETLIPAAVRKLHHHHRAAYFDKPVRRRMGVGLNLFGQHRNGSTFAVEVSLAADASADPLTVIAAVRDVTEQRAIEAAVRLSEVQLRQLAEHVDTVFILRQLNPFAYLYISPAFVRVTGWSTESIVASPGAMLEIVHPDDRQRVAEVYLAVSQQGLPARSEHRIIRPDGAVRWVRTFAAPVPNPHGVVERSVITLEDVTERVEAMLIAQRAEDVARTANEAKTSFLSRMSHELRTPLNAILGFGQLLEREVADPNQLESVGHIVKAGRHLHSLINEVLDITRIESGELTVSLEPIQAESLMDETVRLLEPLASVCGVAMRLRRADAGIVVVADRQRLRQVLLNLLSNAIKYNRRGGFVWLDCAADGEDAVITVRDNGQGISKAMHGRVFTPFDRLDAEGSAVEGTGVGLAVTRALVDLMGGGITFESGPDTGTSFRVTLPLTSSPETVLADDYEPEVATDHEALPDSSILLYVEDNEPNVKLIQSLLRLRPGWKMLHAGTVGLGLDLARTRHIDLVLLDLHLPDGSGFDVLAELKRDQLTAGIPVVVLTTDANVGLENRILSAGAMQFMTKPLDIHRVLALLDDTTAGSRA